MHAKQASSFMGRKFFCREVKIQQFVCRPLPQLWLRLKLHRCSEGDSFPFYCKYLLYLAR